MVAGLCQYAANWDLSIFEIDHLGLVKWEHWGFCSDSAASSSCASVSHLQIGSNKF